MIKIQLKFVVDLWLDRRSKLQLVNSKSIIRHLEQVKLLLRLRVSHQLSLSDGFADL